MKTYTVRLNGYPIGEFANFAMAQKFMVTIQLDQIDKTKSLDYIDEAVLKSDMQESKEFLKYIMEK